MPEGAAEFALYDASDLGEDAKPVCTLVTGTDGTATSPDLPIGSYILKQTKGADGFKFIDDQTINITRTGPVLMAGAALRDEPSIRTGPVRVIQTF